jgi:oligosaccharide repeat unit polymerase
MVYGDNFHYTKEYSGNSDEYSSASIFFSKLLLTIFYFCSYISYIVFKNTFKLSSKAPWPKFKKLKFIENTLLFGYYLLVLVVSLLQINFILGIGIGDYLQNRIMLNKGLGVVSLIIYSSNILILVLLINSYLYKGKTLVNISRKTIIFSSVILFSVIYLLIGSRLSVILLLIQILFSFIYLKEKLSRAFVIKTGVFLFLLVFSLSFFGFMRVRVKNTHLNLYEEFAKVYVEKITENLVVNFGKFENVVWMNDNMDKWSPLYGKTFLAGFTTFIPRKLWDNKPLGGGPALWNWIKPGSYDISAKNAKNTKNVTSTTTGYPAECYMNFHIFGFIFGPFILSFFLALLKIMFNKLNGNILQFSIYIYLLVAICFVFLYGEFLGIFTRTIFVVTPFMLIMLLGKFKLLIKK